MKNVPAHPKQLLREDVSNFTIKFDGENEIDVETLSSVLGNIVDMLKNITTEIDPQAYVRLTVKDTKKGSFEVDLSTVVSQGALFAALLYDTGVAGIAATCIATFRDILEIKKHLQGKEAESIVNQGDKVIVENFSGKQINVNAQAGMYFKNAHLDNCVVNMFNTLNNDQQRTDMHMLQDGIEQITIKREEYAKMSVPIISGDNGQITKHKDIIEAKVYIKKPDFRGNSKWGLILCGNPIMAEIKDLEWLQKVRSGVISGFGARVTIPVELEVAYEVDGNNETIPGSHRYSVIKVTGEFISEPENEDMFQE